MIDPPDSAIYALIATLCFAGSQVTLSRGVVYTSVVSAVVIGLTASLVVIGLFLIFDPPRSFDGTAVLLFVLAGLAAPGISRWAATSAVQRLGPSIAVPMMQGARPLLAIGGALLFLNEELSLQRLVGLLLILAGGWQLSRSREDSQPRDTLPLGVEAANSRTSRRRFRPGVLFPIGAALAYATSDLLVKNGLNHLAHPQLGAFVGITSALFLWGALFIFVSRFRRQWEVRRDCGWNIVSGIFAGLALISLFSALEHGEITLVSPIIASQPLIVFVLSWLFLRKIEKLQGSTVIAGCAVVLGTGIVWI